MRKGFLASAGARVRRAMLAVAAVWALPVSASAVTIPLGVELDTGASGAFGRIEISEADGALLFEIRLDPAVLGAGADLNEFYFNLAPDIEGLRLAASDAPRSEYRLSAAPAVRGGAGSDFDWVVRFGNGAGPKGNGALQAARFTLRADDPLSIAMLDELAHASGGSLPLSFAAHIQGTSLVPGSTSETLGGLLVPEPSTAALLAVGALLLAARRGRKACVAPRAS